ncbi:MAG: hypothetical protein JXA93_21805 [Anaerolineae bacterium]|nr:hypothetical protein [Anaerolineae bacterium]
MREKAKEAIKNVASCAGLAILAAAILALCLWLAWIFFLNLDSDTARTWAFVATLAFLVLTPALSLAGWWYGHTEARGRLAGIDQAVDKVIGAADQVVSVKVNATRLVKQASQEPVPYVILPPAEPSYTLRRSLPAGEVIDVG